MRELSVSELRSVGFLTENDVPHGLLELTATGLAKSILDATAPFRRFLQEAAVHDFDRQAQGPDFKVVVPSRIFHANGTVDESNASLYRPVTKSGDPRVWFSGLKLVASPGDIVAVVWAERRLNVLNLSSTDIALESQRTRVLRELFHAFVAAKSSAVDSLLSLLRGVSEKGFIAAPVKGPTAVGRLLETELGIAINSRRDPDFRGIEIKSSRSSKNRTTLFAKTPDWGNSRFKSSRELLAEFGYDRDGRRKLSCTISGIVENSQSLSLKVDEKNDRVEVLFGAQRQSAVRWELEALRHSLATKHNETFWVQADTKMVGGWEYIRFSSAKHTQKPIIAQLPPLLADGKVTVDFLIREEGDKGYLFKILPKNLPALFPPAKSYELSTSEQLSGSIPEMRPTLF